MRTLRLASLWIFMLPLVIFTTGFAVYAVATKPDVYLKAGNVIRFTKIYDSGAKQAAVTQIETVTTVNGVSAITAKCKMYDDVGKFVIAYNYKFYVDSVNWCADPLNWMFVSDPTSNDAKTIYESDSLVYPLNMKTGDTLLPAKAKKTSGGKGMGSEETQFTYNRKVEKLDTIKTGMGELTAWRITCKVSSHSKMDFGNMGSTNNEDLMNVTQWFIPQYGLVMEERTGKYGTTRFVIQALK